MVERIGKFDGDPKVVEAALVKVIEAATVLNEVMLPGTSFVMKIPKPQTIIVPGIPVEVDSLIISKPAVLSELSMKKG